MMQESSAIDQFLIEFRKLPMHQPISLAHLSQTKSCNIAKILPTITTKRATRSTIVANAVTPTPEW